MHNENTRTHTHTLNPIYSKSKKKTHVHSFSILFRTSAWRQSEFSCLVTKKKKLTTETFVDVRHCTGYVSY